MKIGIDARLFSQTGVGRYIRNMILELQKLDKNNYYCVYLTSNDFKKLILTNPKWHKKLLNARWHSLKEQFIVPFVLYKDKLDFVHFPYFNVPILYGGKFILTLHDLIIDHFDTGKASRLPFLLYKFKRIAYKIITKIGIKKAEYVLTISDSTKLELLDHYKIKREKVVMTYEGIDQKYLDKLKTVKPRKYYKTPYILYVGNAYPHKNLERLISAFKIIIKRKKIKLVLAGDDDYFYPRLKEFVKLHNLKNEIIFFGQANDEELIGLYKYAECLIFPSLMEGFGLPSLEAVYAGCLPVVSDIPVFREIWGKTFDYFDPNEENDIAEKILKVLSYTKEFKGKIILSAKKRAESYNWQRTSQMIYDAYMLCE